MNILRISGVLVILIGIVMFMATETENLYAIITTGGRLILAYLASWIFLLILIILFVRGHTNDNAKYIQTYTFGLLNT